MQHTLDGDHVRFWPNVSGLLTGSQCESLLSAIANQVRVARGGDQSDRSASRLLLLLLNCHFECATELPREVSPVISKLMKSVGPLLGFTHVSAKDARVVAGVLRRYSSSVEDVSLFSTMMDDSSASILFAGLQNCTQLTYLNSGMPSNAANSQAVAKVIEQNKSSLHTLVTPAVTSNQALRSVVSKQPS